MLPTLALWCSLASAGGWPDIDQPLKSGHTAEADAALVIGVEEYYELPGVPHARADAQAFRDYLVYTRGLRPSNVELLNQRGTTSAGKIRAAAKRLGEAVGHRGTAWVYFAGHGAASPTTGERLLMGATTTADAEVFVEGTVAVAELEELAGAGGGRVFAVLDTCYAGAGVIDQKRFAVPSYAVAATATVGTWNAAGPNQLSGPLPDAGHGAFTYFAIGALRGWADGVFHEPDGKVTAEEAQEYVARALRAAQIRDQVPVLAAEEPGSWVLASGGLETGPDLARLPVAGAERPDTRPERAHATPARVEPTRVEPPAALPPGVQALRDAVGRTSMILETRAPTCTIPGDDGPCGVAPFVAGEFADDPYSFRCEKLEAASYRGSCVGGLLEGVVLVDVPESRARKSAAAFLGFAQGGRFAYPLLQSHVGLERHNFNAKEVGSLYGCVYHGNWDRSDTRDSCPTLKQMFGADVMSEASSEQIRAGTFDVATAERTFRAWVAQQP